MATPIARLNDVHKAYGAESVLRGISLDIAEGELVSLVGRSGSGKSTLLHLLGGLDRRYRGRVEVLGQDLARLDDGALSALRNGTIGFVFQSFNLLDHLSVRENVALPASFSPSPPLKVAAQVDRVLERVGMSAFSAARPGRLSGGQRQRVAIARALFMAPRLLLCDEPTGNLDAETGRQVIELFRQLNADGLTLVIVTHEERVSRTARRVLRIDDGQLVPEAAA